MIGARAAQLDGENPWPGLESFKEDASGFFHGRDREAESLLSHVLDAPVTVLYGKSGLGKTSLLRAGLFPLLRQRHFLPVYVRLELVPGAAPLTRQLYQSVGNSIRAEVPDATVPLDEESLWEYLHRADFELWSARNYPLTPVIVLDQFEELFTLGERVPDRVREFMNDLGDLAENRIPADLATRIEDDEAVAERFKLRSRNYKLLISLREDFLPELEGWRQLIPALGRSRVRLLPLRAGEAFDAVYKPAAHMMTDALAHQVVRIIAGEGLQRVGDTAGADIDRPGARRGASGVEPALLSLFCRELNEERKRRGQPRFGEQLVEDAGRNILPNYYSSCLRDLPSSVARFIETELITNKGFRRGYARDDAVPSRLTDDQLAHLIGSRLLRLEERAGAEWIELTHDVLTPVVRKRAEQRRAADERAAEHEAEKQRQQAELQAAKLRAAQEREQAARERQETAEAHAVAMRRHSRILRALLAATAIIAIAAVILGVAALLAMSSSSHARHQAQANLRASIVRVLIAQAQGMMVGTIPGGDAQAFQQTLAAHSLAKDLANDNAADDAVYAAVVQRASTLKIIPGHTGAVTDVAFSLDGHRLASASADKTVRLWNADTGQQIAILTGHSDAVTSVAFSPDGHRLASASYDQTVRLWNPDKGQQIATLTGHTAAVLGVAFSPDGQRLASASADTTVRLWNPDKGQQIATLTGHTAAVLGVAFSPDGQRLASASADTTVRLWNPDKGQQIATLNGHTAAVNGVAFSPDGHRLASASNDQTVRLWNPDNGQPIGAPVTGDTGAVTGVAFSPDGQRLASASSDQTVRLWNPDNGQPIGAPVTGHTRAVLGVAFGPDGHRLASASYDQTVRLWDVDVVENERLVGHTDAVTGVAFSSDGHRLASASADTTVRLWNPDNGQQIATLTGHTAAVNGVAFSPDGQRLASASSDQTVRLWNPDTGQQIAILTGHTAAVNGVAFSPDGQRLASASADTTVRLWNADSGQQNRTLTGHTRAVNGVAFSPDGHRLASASSDQTVRLWNPVTGQQISEGDTGAMLGLAFSPDGHRLASASNEKLVRLWPADASPEMLCAKLTANMSHKQWREWVSRDIEYNELCPGLPIPADA